MTFVTVIFVVGLLLITLNELLTDKSTRVVTKYIPRDLDAWFKDPENQPTYMYTSMFKGENVRTI
jgi:hypothetical protein